MIGIILTGYARSGKDTVADYIAENYGWGKFVFSDCLVDAVKERGMEVNKENMSLVGDELRKERGMDVAARLTYEKAEEANCEKAVFVGARSVEEVDYLKQRLEKVHVVKITADADKRFERKSEKDPQEENDFFARDKRDVEKKGLNKVIDSATHTIENNSDLGELESNICKFIEKV